MIYKCPVCNGKGLVPNGFYTVVGVDQYTSISTAPEVCRSCSGSGIIRERDETDYEKVKLQSGTCKCDETDHEKVKLQSGTCKIVGDQVVFDPPITEFTNIKYIMIKGLNNQSTSIRG